MLQFTFTDPATGFTALVTVVENGDGTLSVTLDVDESTGITGDVRALYFNTTDNAEYTDLAATVDASASDTTTIAQAHGIDSVRYVGSRDTNVNGEVVNENGGGFDYGIEFGTQGIATDDVQHMEFTLDAAEDLTLESFDWTTIGLRVTSVGEVDGPRDGSLKLTGDDTTSPEVSTVVAEDDQGGADLTLLQEGGVDTAVAPRGPRPGLAGQ